MGRLRHRRGRTLGPAAPPSEPLGGSSDQHPLFAAMKCPPNSHYELCADTCSLSCSALSASPLCPESCAEGCQCDSGFLSNGQACVPIQQCGCYQNGIYYEVGSRSLWSEARASRWTPSHGRRSTACPLGLLNVSPTCPLPPSWPHRGPVCHLPHVPSMPSLLLPLGHLPDGSGKTFLKTAMGPATLNPPLAPRV